MLPSLAITGWAAWRVRSTYARWSKVDSGIDLSAFDFARRLLDRQGLTDVKIEPVAGQLTDHYDPRGKVLRVSSAVSGTRQLGQYNPTDRSVGFPQGSGTLSVAAAAVIAHEVGHALQDRERDPWMAARQLIVPAAQLGSSLAPWLIIAGVWFAILELAWVGLIFFGAAVARLPGRLSDVVHAGSGVQVRDGNFPAWGRARHRLLHRVSHCPQGRAGKKTWGRSHRFRQSGRVMRPRKFRVPRRQEVAAEA